jgi:hypothetical protein
MSNSEKALWSKGPHANDVFRTRQVIEPRPPLAADTPRDPYDRDRLREEWRLAALAWAAAEDQAERLDEGRKVLLDRLTLEIAAEVKSIERARMMARTSWQFQEWLADMHAAKRKANDARIDMQDKDRRYWAHVGNEANERVEKRMSR